MKFAKKDALIKESDIMTVREYCSDKTNLPMDGAVVTMNGTYGPILNKEFTQLLFIIKGKVILEMDDETVELLEEDLYIMPPEKAYKITGEDAKMFFSCTPPFKPENVKKL